MIHHLIAGISLLLVPFIAGCRRTPAAPPAAPPIGHQLTTLPHAPAAPAFEPPGGCYAEALLSGGQWRLRPPLSPAAGPPPDGPLPAALAAAKERSSMAGFEPLLLVSADAATTCGQIAALIRETASAGILHLHFLVRLQPTAAGDTAPRSLPVVLSSPASSSIIDPILVQITETGDIAVGSGASMQVLDAATAPATLPKLSAQLEMYAAAARSANCSPVAMVLPAPAARYQRLIDVLSRLHHQGIRPDLTSSLPPRG